ncbi:hypothetical protein B7486_48360 [cyanobacterium TDX16]|nr:hypothetical protein B7486_48360 [cyanobacterium TDX16]
MIERAIASGFSLSALFGTALNIALVETAGQRIEKKSIVPDKKGAVDAPKPESDNFQQSITNLKC